jgi:methylmalonyl-CoA mutase cobalamin-binding domain/chain
MALPAFIAVPIVYIAHEKPHNSRSPAFGHSHNVNPLYGPSKPMQGLGEDRGNHDSPIRILIAKVGLDGHDRGVKIVARALRDAGMDVIYSGLHRTPEEVVNTAVQEDVDVLGVSLLSGAHMTIFPRLLELLEQNDARDIILVGGGVMPDADVVALKAMGVAEILLQDTPPNTIVDTVRRLVAERGPR